MKKVFVSLVIISLCVIQFLVVSAIAEPLKTFDNTSLRGRYSYLLSGNFGMGLAGTIVEVGVFESDGNGIIVGEGTAVVNGEASPPVTYDCTYSVNPNGRAEVDCDRTITPPPPSAPLTAEVSFSLSLGDNGKEVRFTANPANNPPFDVVSITGTARKQ